MASFSDAEWPSWAYPPVDGSFSGYQPPPNYPAYFPESMGVYQAHQNHLIHPHHMSRATESKPRLSKEEVEVLEAEFQKNHKPNSSTKKALAESMRVDNARINNWFQNRRAREKKENNIREYEARQKLEKEKTEAETGRPVDHDRRCDLVASSAPFPEPRRTSESQMHGVHSPSNHSVFDLSSEVVDPIQCAATDDHSPPFVPPPQALDSTSAAHMHSTLDAGMNGAISEQMRQCLVMSDTGIYVQGDNMNLEMLLPFSDDDDGMTLGSMGVPAQPFSQHWYPSGQQQDNMQYQDTGYINHDISSNTTARPSSMSTESRLKSPAPVDIASRRNRRPPPLTIASGRSYSACVPKTAVDTSKRGEQNRIMRRVASATGPMRITKPTVTPRSPFFDPRAESMLQMSRSPSFGGPGAAAPPTPNTPAACSQFGLGDAAGKTGFAMGGKHPSVSWAVPDPTLSTPPSTPGGVVNLFSFDSGYGMPVSDDIFETPGVSNFAADFDFSTPVSGAPGNIGSSNGGSSQPESPLYGPGLELEPSNFLGGNTEFTIHDHSGSVKAPPGLTAEQTQYMNTGTLNVGN